jgi:hypothetical protein
LLLAPETGDVDDEMSDFGIKSNFYTVLCLLGVSEENFVKSNDDCRKVDSQEIGLANAVSFLFGRYQIRITSLAFSSVSWICPGEFQV